MSQDLSQGLEKAPCRALLKAHGFTDEQISSPTVAVITASGILNGESAAKLAESVCAGILADGYTPVTVPLSCMNDAMVFGGRGGKYALPARELIADWTEALLSSHMFDGAVFIPDGDIAAAGMLMGAARVNIPSAFVSFGAAASGRMNGGKIKVGLSSISEGIGKVNGGKLSRDELADLENDACPSDGASNGLYGGNSMACALEAMGMALSGNGCALAGSGERLRLAVKTGRAACALVRDAVVPRMIMTKRAILNAMTFTLATGGSLNTLLHLTALADECNISITPEAIQKQSDNTPTLCTVFPFSDTTDMTALSRAGGVKAILHELAKKNIIDGSVHTVGGEALADCYENAEPLDCKIIAKAEKPLLQRGGAVTVKGTLAEDGAMVRRAQLERTTFVGKAKCFDSEEDAVAAVGSGRIKEGDAVIVRYEGPVGGPGMRELKAIVSALYGAGLDKSVLLVTDGRIPDETRCAAVAHVTPEAALGGKIALAKDGDTIKLDLGAGRINLDVPAKELQARQKKLRPKDPTATGVLLRYQNLVTDANQGAVLKKKF